MPSRVASVQHCGLAEVAVSEQMFVLKKKGFTAKRVPHAGSRLRCYIALPVIIMAMLCDTQLYRQLASVLLIIRLLKMALYTKLSPNKALELIRFT